MDEAVSDRTDPPNADRQKQNYPGNTGGSSVVKDVQKELLEVRRVLEQLT